jgi:hypothetical protein
VVTLSYTLAVHHGEWVTDLPRRCGSGRRVAEELHLPEYVSPGLGPMSQQLQLQAGSAAGAPLLRYEPLQSGDLHGRPAELLQDVGTEMEP